MQTNPKSAHEKMNWKAAFIAGAITILIIAMLLVTNIIFPFAAIEKNAGELYGFTIAREFLGMAVLGLSVMLLFTYTKSYLEIKSGFTFGLMVAVIACMMFALTSSPWFRVLSGFSKDSGLSIIPMFFALIGLGVLAWVSEK